MEKPIIERFIINGLFGKRDVELYFSHNTQIYIGENGIGKTTILNALYYVLSLNFKKLSEIKFESIELYVSGKRISFNKSDINKYFKYLDFKESIFNKLDMGKYLNAFLKDVQNKKSQLHDDTGKKSKKGGLVEKNISIEQYINNEYKNKISEIINSIKTSIEGFEVLYFPTYRRIEEDLKSLGIFSNKTFNKCFDFEGDHSKEVVDDEGISLDDSSLIQFGMNDVEKMIESLTQKISRSSAQEFSKLTSSMLKQLLISPSNTPEHDTINVEDIKIILDRVEGNLSKEDKDGVLKFVSSEKKFEENKHLAYFLYKLLEIYRSQKKYDDAIKNFKDACNDYLNDKHYEYNESTVTLSIKDNDDRPISPAQLSSGEKQIVSLFSKIYLNIDKKFIVLFDEPELSLSILWQKKLLPDIIKSERCAFILAVTHSPFIFENELLDNTKSLKECFKEKEND